jgi:two-component system chemotaxis response regulator CheB
MAKIRVLIVDDAVVVRRTLADVLAGDSELEVVGTAANGRIALAKIPQVNPDLITLDMEMPEMDGLQTLAAIRKNYPQMPVIMFSAVTLRGAAATLDALALGARDYVTKPANVGCLAEAMQRIREQLIPKIKAFCPRTPVPQATIPQVSLAPARIRSPAAVPLHADGQRVEVLAIGVSTGGPNALAVLLPEFPADFPIPIVIVQHMPPLFTRTLADRLASKAAFDVCEGAEGDEITPGKAWLAPGGYHMVTRREGMLIRLGLNQAPPENSCRPAVDVLFRSVARTYGPSALAVVLTGMGQDGLRGCECIREAGGRVLVQDQATSVVWGMPGCVAAAGLADQVLPVHQLATEILRRVRKGRALLDGVLKNS